MTAAGKDGCCSFLWRWRRAKAEPPNKAQEQSKAETPNEAQEQSKAETPNDAETPNEGDKQWKQKSFLNEQRRLWAGEAPSPDTSPAGAKVRSTSATATNGDAPTPGAQREENKSSKAPEVRPPWLDWHHYDELDHDGTLLGALINQETVMCMDKLGEFQDEQLQKIAEAVEVSNNLQKLQFVKPFVVQLVRDGRQRILLQLWQAMSRSRHLTLLTLAEQKSNVVGRVGPDADPVLQLRYHRTLEEIRFKDDHSIQVVPSKSVLAAMGPVHSAIWRDDEMALRHALEKDPHGAAQPAPQDGCLPLSRAAWLGRRTCVEIVLGQLEMIADSEVTLAPHLSLALCCSAGNRHIEVVQYLLQKRTDPNRPGGGDGWPPLVHAAQWGAEGAVQVLLDSGANPDQRTPQGSTAAMHATVTGQVAVLRMLADARADLGATDQSGLTATMMAAMSGRVDALGVLLEAGRSRGVEVDARSSAGATAAAMAALKGKAAAVSLLLDAKADPDPVVESAQRGSQAAIVELLSARGVHIPPARAADGPEEGGETG